MVPIFTLVVVAATPFLKADEPHSKWKRSHCVFALTAGALLTTGIFTSGFGLFKQNPTTPLRTEPPPLQEEQMLLRLKAEIQKLEAEVQFYEAKLLPLLARHQDRFEESADFFAIQLLLSPRLCWLGQFRRDFEKDKGKAPSQNISVFKEFWNRGVELHRKVSNLEGLYKLHQTEELQGKLILWRRLHLFFEVDALAKIEEAVQTELSEPKNLPPIRVSLEQLKGYLDAIEKRVEGYQTITLSNKISLLRKREKDLKSSL